MLDAKKHKKLIRKIVRLQIKLGFKRPFYKNFPELYGGSTYWTLPREILTYVLNYTNENPRFLKRFSHSFCAEEIYFQTIILNSPFKNNIVNNNLRYIEWEPGKPNPRIFTTEDFDSLKVSSQLFARKFDIGIDEEILDRLDQLIDQVEDIKTGSLR